MTSRFPPEDLLVRCLSRSWWPVALVSEVDTGPQETLLLDKPLVVFRGEGGSHYVTDAVCPHRGASLALGKVCGETIACPYHGWQFEGGSGRCVRIPALGEAQNRIPRDGGVKSYRSQVLWGIVWTCLDDTAPFNIPGIDEISRPGWRMASKMTPQNTNMLFSSENFCDVAHFAFLHLKTFGYSQESVGKLEVQRRGYEVTNTFRFDLSAVEDAGGDYGTGGSVGDFFYRFHAPGFIQSKVTSSTIGEWVLTHFTSPATLETTHVYRVVAVPPELAFTPEALMEVDDETYREDGVVAETIRPRRLGASLEHQQHTLADEFTVGIRNAFLRWIDDQASAISASTTAGAANATGDRA